MKNKIYEYLKFELGSESYSYEFEIIPIPPYEIIKNGISLEPYEYFGEINEILGYKVRQIILYYNADVLMKVEIKFKGNILYNLIQQLVLLLEKNAKSNLILCQHCTLFLK